MPGKLTIRREQLEALRAPLIEAQVARLVEHARECFPDETGDRTDEALTAHVERALERAERYRITAERDVYKYVDVSVLHGPDFDRREETAWMTAYLTDEEVSSPSQRMSRLYEEVVRRLEVEEQNRRLRREVYGEEAAEEREGEEDWDDEHRWDE